MNKKQILLGLECCQWINGQACHACPYFNKINRVNACEAQLMNDAYALIKEQDRLIKNYERQSKI